MRGKLNNNPVARVAVLGVLLVAAGFFVIFSMGGGDEEDSTTTTTSATVTTPDGSATVTATVTKPSTEAGAATASIPPPPGAAAPPHAVTAAFAANETVVLLFVHNGGIDDRMVADIVDRLGALPRIATFVVPADRIARYAAIAQGVDVDRVPALVVLRPKRLDRGIPTASVSYGFQSPESVVQAIVDAGYRGRTIDYHP